MKPILTTFLALSTLACASTQAAQAPTRVLTDDAQLVARESAIREMLGNFQRVRFEFDSSLITTDTKDALSANVAIMTKFPELKVEIAGHCDEVGSTEYNLALGERRAEAIKKYMMASSIDPMRLSTISYGEEAPVDDGASDQAHRANRRAEFRVTYLPPALDPTPAVTPLALR